MVRFTNILDNLLHYCGFPTETLYFTICLFLQFECGAFIIAETTATKSEDHLCYFTKRFTSYA